MKNLLKTVLLVCFVLVPASQLKAASTEEIVKLRENILVPEGKTVERAISFMGSVQVNGTVEDEVVSILGNITVGSKGKVLGDAVSIGGKVVRKKGSRVDGKEVSFALPIKNAEKFFFLAIPAVASMVAAVIGIATVFSSIGFVALIVVVLTLFEKHVLKASQVLVKNPWKSFFLGLLGFCGIIPVLVFLTVTVIGIPLAFLGAAAAMAALVLGSVAVGHWVGTAAAKRLNWKLKSIWTGLFGILLLFVVGLVPFLGNLIQICVLFLGLGTILQTRFKA